MRALSIRQPWAELILQGHKTIEVRSQRTNIRERVYIYAGATGSKRRTKPGSQPTSASTWMLCPRRPGRYGRDRGLPPVGKARQTGSVL